MNAVTEEIKQLKKEKNTCISIKAEFHCMLNYFGYNRQ